MPQNVGQGGQITLRVQYQAGNGLPVDPVGPSVSILRPNGTTEITAVPTKETTGTYFYTFNVPVAAPLGDWIGRFSGTINGNPVTGDDPFTVVAAGVVVPLVPAPLLTLTELKTAMDIDPTDTRRDAQLNQAITFASQAILMFTERDFGAPLLTEERTYQYDGSGYLDIDDASIITDVKVTVPSSADVALNADEWRAMPNRRDDSPVFYYVYMPGVIGTGPFSSPEMGFGRNLDVAYAEGRWRGLPTLVKVIGSFGWPAVPADVKLAAIWTIQDWTSRPSGEGLAAEAIENFSRSWAGKAGMGMQAMAIPNRARDLLAQYQRQLA